MIDGNKTALTHRVTAAAAAYLANLGCKPVETEVPVGFGFVADVATYWYPTNTEAKRFHIPERLAAQLGIDRLDVPPVWRDGPLTVSIEVKTTRSDFLADQRKWLAPPLAHIAMIAFPHGMIEVAELPDHWYGLETSEDGRIVLRLHRNRGWINPQHIAITCDFIAAVGIRRHHRTVYASFRDWRKAARAEENEQRVRFSARRLLIGLADWLRATTSNADRPLLEVLPELGVRKIPENLESTIAFYESLRSKRRSLCEES